MNRSLSLLAALFRLLFVAIFAVNILNWLNALQSIVDGAANTSQLQVQLMLHLAAYEYGANVAFVFFGIHIAVVAFWLVVTIPAVLAEFSGCYLGVEEDKGYYSVPGCIGFNRASRVV